MQQEEEKTRKKRTQSGAASRAADTQLTRTFNRKGRGTLVASGGELLMPPPPGAGQRFASSSPSFLVSLVVSVLFSLRDIHTPDFSWHDARC